MRKYLALILLIVATFIGCDNPSNNNTANSNSAPPDATNTNSTGIAVIPPIRPKNSPDANFKSCNPYMPLVPGSMASYTLKYPAGLVADVDVVVDLETENGQSVFVERTRIHDKLGGSQKSQLETRKYACDGNRVKILDYDGQNYVEGKLTATKWEMRNDPIAMIDPAALARKGTAWSYSFYYTISAPDREPVRTEDPLFVQFESLGAESVTVPAGTFSAIKVKRKVGQNEVLEYWVRGMGLVKRQMVADGTSWELKEYSGIKPTDTP